jgi:hypothetical protein
LASVNSCPAAAGAFRIQRLAATRRAERSARAANQVDRGDATTVENLQSESENPWGESLPLKLLRDGWKPHCFPNSTIMVVLPPEVFVSFSDKGVLNGLARREGPFLTATLHSNPKFTRVRQSALDFVAHLANKKRALAIDVATYRYFVDPTEARDDSRIITFYVIGIPGAVVVVTLSRPLDAPPSGLIERMRRTIPYIVGELA